MTIKQFTDFCRDKTREEIVASGVVESFCQSNWFNKTTHKWVHNGT